MVYLPWTSQINSSIVIQSKLKHLRTGVTTHDIRCTKGLDIRLIPVWYPWYPGVGFGRNMAVSSNFQVFHSLTTVPWYVANKFIFRYIQLIFFKILPKSFRYLTEVWSIFSWYPFIVPLISGWYPWYPDLRCIDFQQRFTPCLWTWIIRSCQDQWPSKYHCSFFRKTK